MTNSHLKNTPFQTRSFAEFVFLMASMMSMVALSIDAMLPALPQMAKSLDVVNPNHIQLVISFVFLGMASGTLIVGPLADSYGRKPVAITGFVIFMLACFLSYHAQHLETMLLARFLQGLGVSAPRVLTTTLVRDHFSGRQMARVMSFVMTIFILVPIIAPFFGQWILTFANWRAIFLGFIFISLAVSIWFALRQKETLKEENRQVFSAKVVFHNYIAVTEHRLSLAYTLASGLVTGAFIAFLSASQPIFDRLYGVADDFVYYFATLAIAIGLASFLNSRLVLRFGMRKLSMMSLSIITLLSMVFIAYDLSTPGNPALFVMMSFFSAIFFCMGILFGNLNAQAMEPLGDLAGVGASFVGSVGMFIGLPIGIISGQMLDQSLMPVLLTLLMCSFGSLVIISSYQIYESSQLYNTATKLTAPTEV